jgi:hypothetical protein
VHEYNTIWEGVQEFLERYFKIPLVIGFDNELFDWLDVEREEVDGFCAFVELEKIPFDGGFSASTKYEFRLYIRKIKLENEIPRILDDIVRLVADYQPQVFWVGSRRYHIELDGISVDAHLGDTYFTIPITIWEENT